MPNPNMSPAVPPRFKRGRANLSRVVIPEGQRRRGSYIIRLALERVTLKQNPAALKAAARMLLLLPLAQGAILVGILNGEPWMLLLCAEGLLMAWLAASQLLRPTAESRLIGYGVGVLNVGGVALVGAFLGAPVLWLTGVLALLPFSWLVLRPTRARTIRNAWLMFIVPLLVLATFAGYTRVALERSPAEQDPTVRLSRLNAAWHGMQLRGYNGTERALLRLRQAQAAFESGDYEQAFHLADDGLQDERHVLRPLAKTPLGEELINSLIKLKAQAYYNRAWNKNDNIATSIRREPLEEEMLVQQAARVRWGW
jgi:hypothetical protein